MSDVTSITNYQYADTTSTDDTVSGTVSFTGLGSGTDFQSIVDQLVEIESIHKTRLETWKATWEAKVTSMETLNSYLDNVQEAAEVMDETNEFLVRTASTSDSTIVTGSTTNSANTGAYSVVVGTDVKHIVRSAGVDSNSTDVVSGDGGILGFYIGSTYTTVAIGASDDLDTIAAAINAKVGSNIATVEDDGTDSRSYHLVLTSNVGGDDGRFQVVQNPTDLSFGVQDVVMDDDSSWGSVTVDLAGQFIGDKADAEVYQYVFTAHTSGTTVTVGTDEITLTYDVINAVTGTTISSGTTITVSAGYAAGDCIYVDNGFNIQLGDGDIIDGESFSLRAYANDIDEAEETDWSAGTISTSGNYLGTVNKTYSFSVVTSGEVNDSGTGGTAVLRWTDSTGGTGTVTVSQSSLAYEVDSGVMVSFTSGGLYYGETFQVNVFAPDQQMGQDRGLAQAAKVVHSGWADETTSAITSADATFAYTYGGEEVILNVEGGSTLSQLVTAINEDSDNPGVVASIINDGQGLPTSYKLVLTGQDTGAAYQITSVEHTFDTSFATDGDLGGGFTTSQYATNSMVKVDGYPSEDDVYLQRDTNTIDEVIEGVTLNLHDAGEAVVTISNDTESIYANIEALVTAVNAAQDYIRQETYYDSDQEETGLLIGNYSYYLLKTTIDSLLNTSVSGLVDGEDPYTTLAQIGISTDPDDEGRWVIDSETLYAALESDAEGVANLFVENETKGSTGVAARTWEKMEEMLDSDTGTLNVLISNYNQIIENIEAKIEKEEDRLALYEERQLARFARLETTLSELNSQADAIESAIEQLPSSN